jgi:hypothetical protein
MRKFLFISPLFFQVILKDNPSKAGMRLVIPSLATPIGGVVAGVVMSRRGCLSELVRVGCFLMMAGNALVASLRYHDASWKYLLYLLPANLGQGICYPAILFTFLAAFDHSGTSYFPNAVTIAYLIDEQSRQCRRLVSSWFDPSDVHGEWQHLRPGCRTISRNSFRPLLKAFPTTLK